MEHLKALDAMFLQAEDADRHISLAVAGVSILEGPIPDDETLVSEIERRVVSMPRARQVLRTHPLGLDLPEWVDDPSFDLGHHLRRVAVPHPGDDAALYGVITEVMERRLDRDRPLWECWIIEGLPEGRWAMLMKLHHCIADGIAATKLTSGFYDDGGAGTFADRIRAAKEHEPAARLSLNPLNWVGGIWHLSALATKAATQVTTGLGQVIAGLAKPTGRSSLTGPITSRRRYAAASVSMADITKVCETYDVTLNDVALAAITDSYRALLKRRGEKLRPDMLRTFVPVSVRAAEDYDKTDNRVAGMLPVLPVDEENPLERLQEVHRRLAKAKASGQRQTTTAVIAAANRLPFPLTTLAVRLLSRLPQRSVVALATNVPGPRRRIKMMGREVVQMLPIPPIAMQLQTGIAMLSYADRLIFGIIADYDGAPDVDGLAKGIEDGVARLATICRARNRTSDRQKLSALSTG